MSTTHQDWRALAGEPVSYPRPNIIVCGPSGAGKSTSLRNLDPATTIVINTERKALPFRGAASFTKQAQPINLEQFDLALTRALASDATVIVIDSFTSLAEYVYADVIRYELEDTRAAWGRYKDTLHDILLTAKVHDKSVVFLAVEATTQDDNMRVIKSVDVQGSLRGKVEKEFEIVLWAQPQGEGVYRFLTNTDGRCTAKSPMGMFNERLIDNDLQAVLASIHNYYSSN
ncbi:MAG: AAA family ATPase [Granulosicoccus sp.]